MTAMTKERIAELRAVYTGDVADDALILELLDEVERRENNAGIAERVVERVNLDNAALRADNERLRAALREIQAWDCLHPPQVELWADLPWLQRIVDAALGEEPKT